MRESVNDHEAHAAAVWDVVICGGGLAGLLLARHIRRELPELSIALVERTRRPLPDACHKVGESSVELGSQYLDHLGLRDYMQSRQLVKMGIRFFPGGGDLPLHLRTEIGPCAEPIVRSYQLDRGRLESDLRGLLEDDGVTLFEGGKVTEIELGRNGSNHCVTFARDDTTQRLIGRWVVDATGRAGLLRRRQKLTRSNRHIASAGWFRVTGLLDTNDLVPKTELEWHARPLAAHRWRSTNHFMGKGYWVWLIPLSTGHTSVGLVIHEDSHDCMNIAGLDRVLQFLERHEPHLARAVARTEIKDFLCLRNYSYGVARSWSEDRWALVGEAGAFVDPLFSPGTDFIAFANSFTVELLRADRAGDNLKMKVGTLNAMYRALIAASTDLFRQASPVFGHASAMANKVFWDNFAYWSFTCQYLQQGLYRLDGAQQEPFATVGRRFRVLTNHVETLLHTWAELAPERPTPVFRQAPAFPSVLVDAHIAVAKKMSPAATLDYVTLRLEQGQEIIGEIVLRIVQELGPELGQKLLDTVQFSTWGVTIPPKRLDVEALAGRARRQRLSAIARDVERALGPVRRHDEAGPARELLAQGAIS